jgi:predicted dienelactone hydrolase
MNATKELWLSLIDVIGGLALRLEKVAEHVASLELAVRQLDPADRERLTAQLSQQKQDNEKSASELRIVLSTLRTNVSQIPN